jgi:AraC-like DNA-binding protein
MVELSRNDDANVSVVAARAGLSISSLRRLFATQTGLPIGRYLRKLRMGKACLLLETSAHSIKEIAALIGYADASHFSRAFKKSIGATPMQYIDVRII